MKKLIFSLAILLLGWRCTNKNPDLTNNTNPVTDFTVNLIQTDNPTIFSRTAILLNNLDYMIKTPYNAFLSGYPFKLPGYADLKAKAINDITLKDTLYLSNYLKSGSDSIQTLAYYLQTGNCYCLDKHLQSAIQTIHYQKYEDDSAAETRFGRRFYIESVLFLETVDSIRIFK